MARRQCILVVAIYGVSFATENARERAPSPDLDKGGTQQVVVDGGWLSFGTT